MRVQQGWPANWKRDRIIYEMIVHLMTGPLSRPLASLQGGYTYCAPMKLRLVEIGRRREQEATFNERFSYRYENLLGDGFLFMRNSFARGVGAGRGPELGPSFGGYYRSRVISRLGNSS